MTLSSAALRGSALLGAALLGSALLGAGRSVARRGFRMLGALALATGLSALLLSGCAAGAAPAPTPTASSLSQAQAERLAVTRFKNFDAGVRAFTADLPASGQNPAIELSGWMNFATHFGYAAVTQGGASLGLVQFTPETIATRETPISGAAPLPIPSDGWKSAAFAPGTSAFTAALNLVLNLGADRPENPQLLQQSDAAWLRADTIDGTAVDVFAGPSPTADSGAGSSTATATPPPPSDLASRAQYWVDDSGLLLRFSVPLGATTDRTTVDLTDAGGTTPGDAPVGVS